MKTVTDERPWDRDMPIKWKGAEKGSVRTQRCKGSYECENPKFSFKQQHGKANKVQFEKTGMATWCVTVVEDAPSLLLA